MALATQTAVASASQTIFAVTLGFLSTLHIKVFVDDVLQTEGSGDDYTWSGSNVVFNSGMTGGESVVFTRETPTTRVVDFVPGTLTEANLDNDSLQALYRIDELDDEITAVVGGSGNVPGPANPGDNNKFLQAASGGFSWQPVEASDIDLNGAAEAGSVDTSNDAAFIYDASEGANRKVGLDTLLGGVAGFTTGDIKLSLASSLSGWLNLNGESLGDSGSGADNTGTTYESLYTFLWNNIADAEAPVSTGRGASAAADWSAGKTLTMPDARGRSFIVLDGSAGVTTHAKADVAGGKFGSETLTITSNELPAHTHGSGSLSAASAGAHTHTVPLTLFQSALGGASTTTGHVNTSNTSTNSAGAHTHSVSGATGSVGSGSALTNHVPQIAINAFVKL